MPSIRRNIKMEYVLFGPNGFVQLDGGFIRLVGLDVDDISAALLGYVPQEIDQFRCDSAPAMPLLHGQVVDVNLPPLLLEFLQDVSSQAPTT